MAASFGRGPSIANCFGITLEGAANGAVVSEVVPEVFQVSNRICAVTAETAGNGRVGREAGQRTAPTLVTSRLISGGSAIIAPTAFLQTGGHVRSTKRVISGVGAELIKAPLPTAGPSTASGPSEGQTARMAAIQALALASSSRVLAASGDGNRGRSLCSAGDAAASLRIAVSPVTLSPKRSVPVMALGRSGTSRFVRGRTSIAPSSTSSGPAVRREVSIITVLMVTISLLKEAVSCVLVVRKMLIKEHALCAMGGLPFLIFRM